MNKCFSTVFACASLLLTFSTLPQAKADVTLPKVIASHMVLQRDRPLPIWGWAEPGEEVTVKFDDASVRPPRPTPKATGK